MSKNVTSAGIPIYMPETENENRAYSQPVNPQDIEQHAEYYFAQSIDWVFHELVSEYIHLDLLVFNPTEAFPFYRVLTSGMSDRKMKLFPGEEEKFAEQYMELMITLPANWKINHKNWEDEKWYWPIRMLKQVARYPHQYNTRLGYAHTLQIPAGPFDGVIVLPTLMTEEAFSTLQVGSEKTIHFYSIWPLFKAELDYKLEKGFEAFVDLVNENELNETIDVSRLLLV